MKLIPDAVNYEKVKNQFAASGLKSLYSGKVRETFQLRNPELILISKGHKLNSRLLSSFYNRYSYLRRMFIGVMYLVVGYNTYFFIKIVPSGIHVSCKSWEITT